MSKKIKLTSLLITTMVILPTFGSYRVTIPLEIKQGGALQNNTIIFGTDKNTNDGETPSTNCIYNSQNKVQILTSQIGQYQIGDTGYIFNNRMIVIASPSNGTTAPDGLSMGKKQGANKDVPADDYEICFDSNWPDPTESPNQPIDPDNSDWTPECILNTSTDYAAINTINGTREFHSQTFGLNHLTVPHWIYTPADYDPNRADSYKYYDNSEQTGDERVSGPNPDFSYSEICRVRKRD